MKTRRQARSAAQARTSLILDYGKAGYTLKDRSGQQHSSTGKKGKQERPEQAKLLQSSAEASSAAEEPDASKILQEASLMLSV